MSNNPNYKQEKLCKRCGKPVPRKKPQLLEAFLKGFSRGRIM